MTIPDYVALEEAVNELIVQASTTIPADIGAALEAALAAEPEGAARSALELIVSNNRLAARERTPICQDTGYPTFYATLPEAYQRRPVADLLRRALSRQTAASRLRPNSVDALTGRNPGDSTGLLYPAIYFDDSADGRLEIALLLKGGGSENVSCQFKLPDGSLGAGRDLAGVRKVVLKGLLEAQGFGCAPGILGVAIGADRAQGYALAKKQLLRHLDDRSPVPELASLEERLLADGNRLGVGPMGFGGRTTVVGVKVAAAHRHPASFFVTVAYGCWALRRKRLLGEQGRFTIVD